MCGIGGIAGQTLSLEHPDAPDCIREALAHRGPDSSGVERLGGCTLVNTRLAILDLSDRGKQPMSNQDQSIWITYNGECYNAKELRDWLVSRGHAFASGSDTEVVLHLYQEIGASCVERMRGMFAFAVWDKRQKSLILARDRLGIKPLYYARLPNGLIFASELKAILASGIIDRRLNLHGSRAFLQLGHIPPPWTALQGVEPLEPGHIAIWREGSFEKRRYWQLPVHQENDEPHRASHVGELDEKLLEAIRLHLISDVPVALFLSGGVDSAIIGGLCKAAKAADLTALTIGFEDQRYDESALSARTAQLLGLPHRTLRLTGSEIQGSLDHALWAMDQPTVDGLNAYWICQSAAQAGFKVALTGQGGDELFGGYESVKWFTRFYTAAEWLHFVSPSLGNLIFNQDALPFRLRKVSYLVGADDPLVAAELAVKIHFLERDVEKLLGSSSNGASGHQADSAEARAHLQEGLTGLGKSPLPDKIAHLDFYAHLEPRLLRDGDAMSMAHSLEVRPPFLDHKLVEFVSSLPGTLRLRHKKLLLDASRKFIEPSVYQEIVSRPKRTFSFPFTEWLRGSLKPTIDETFQPDRLKKTAVLDPVAVQQIWRTFLNHPARIGWSRVWTLYVLQRWCEVMGVTP